MVAGAGQDLNRRKKNVIITGLMEKPGQSDLRVVTDIVSKCIPLTNPLTISTVYRSGRGTRSHATRKLMVKLANENDASAVLSVAKELRRASGRDISSKVFINADLSKEEAKMA